MFLSLRKASFSIFCEDLNKHARKKPLKTHQERNPTKYLQHSGEA